MLLNRARLICRLVAAEVRDPLAWFRALRSAACAPGCAEPFLLKSAERASDDTRRELAACLEDPSYAGTAVGILLSGSGWSEGLVDRAIEKATNYPEVIGHLCFFGKLSSAILKRLLESGESTVRAAAIDGHWIHLHGRPIDAELRGSWRSAVRRMNGGSHVLLEIISGDEGLAEDWAAARVEASNSTCLDIEDTITLENVAAGLAGDVRRRLLARLTSKATLLSSSSLRYLGTTSRTIGLSCPAVT